MDIQLFLYLSQQAGFTTPKLAKEMGLTTPELNARIASGQFSMTEMKLWAALIGCSNPGPVFFPVYRTAAF